MGCQWFGDTAWLGSFLDISPFPPTSPLQMGGGMPGGMGGGVPPAIPSSKDIPVNKKDTFEQVR